MYVDVGLLRYWMVKLIYGFCSRNVSPSVTSYLLEIVMILIPTLGRSQFVYNSIHKNGRSFIFYTNASESLPTSSITYSTHALPSHVQTDAAGQTN